jgi:hypothetical protein
MKVLPILSLILLIPINIANAGYSSPHPKLRRGVKKAMLFVFSYVLVVVGVVG